VLTDSILAPAKGEFEDVTGKYEVASFFVEEAGVSGVGAGVEDIVDAGVVKLESKLAKAKSSTSS